MRKELEELFEAVREEASRHAWSRGVELARSKAVALESSAGESLSLRVTAPGERVGRSVALDLGASDWSCDCPSTDGACMHVAAAVIATRRAWEEGRELPSAGATSATVGYRFRRSPTGLLLSRVLVRQGSETPLTRTVGAIAAGRVEGPRLSVSEDDLAIDGLIGAKLEGWFPREILEPIFRRLVGKKDVRLDGEPIEVRADRVGVIGRLEEQADGYRLSIVQDPTIDEVFPNGVVRCGRTLKLLDTPDLSAREMEELRKGRSFGPEEVLGLVTDLLPSLSRRIPIEDRTRRLPRAERMAPRLEFHTEKEGDALSVLPTIVYGDPPCARLVGKDLVHLQGPVPVRDPEAERRLERKLHETFGIRPGLRLRYPPGEAIAMVRKLRETGIALRGDAHEAFVLAPPIEPFVGVEGDRLLLRFAVSGEKREADPEAVLRAYRQGESLVPLLGGGYAPLPADWLARYGPLISDLLAARGEDGRVPASSLPDLGRLCEALDLPPPAGLERLRPLVEDFDRLPAPELPEDLRAELRTYQREGVAWLSFLRSAGLGGLLADDMGLGKTLQAACVLGKNSLVVAPTSVLPNWMAELARFRPGLRVALYHGPSRALDPEADVTVTSYAILRLDAEILAGRRWDAVVLDEAQAIKNPESQVAQAAYRLDAAFRLCLSGTPVENRLDELWSLFHFLNRGFLGGRRDFQERYAQPIGDGSPEVAAHLRRRIRPFVLRRRKQEVARELPPRTDLVVRFALSPEEREVYDAIHAATRESVLARLGDGASVMAALEALLRLRQAACHPGLLPGRQAESSSKVELLLDRLAQAVGDGHKALVFSQWTSLLDRVEPHLRGAGIDFVRLDGSTADRGAVVSAFQAEDGPPVLLATLKAGGTGLNLTAADHVFLLDPWWNPAAEDQAADRAHRIGQDRPVFVHRLVAEGTVEERILALQERKRAIAEAAIGDASAASSLTREDLLELLA